MSAAPSHAAAPAPAHADVPPSASVQLSVQPPPHDGHLHPVPSSVPATPMSPGGGVTSTFRPRPLSSQRSTLFADRERAILRAEFNKFDADGNGILDEKEFRAYLSELKLDAKVQAKILAKYDTNGDKTIEFEEFLIAAEHFKHVVMQGVMADAMELSTYWQLGCACCLCTLGLAWIPFCCKQSQMEKRAVSGKYIRDDVKNIKTPMAADNANAAANGFGTNIVPGAAAAPGQPAAMR